MRRLALAIAMSLGILVAGIGGQRPGGIGPGAIGPGGVAAATPAPTTVSGGDPRSAGEGPGLVGTPVLAVGAVVVLGLIAAAGTLAWVRLTGGPRRPR